MIKLPHSNSVTRRDFIKSTSKAGLFCGFACLCPVAMSAEESDIPDPEKLNYCGHVCPKDCPMKLAGESGDVAKKKEAYDMWKLKDRYGLEFNEDDIFCNGCKTDKKLGAAVRLCPVRKCAMKKGVKSCIECKELKTCEQRLWTEFPGFHKHVIDMQAKYLASKTS